MAGTKEGGEAATRTNKAKYGDSFYAKDRQRGRPTRQDRRICLKRGRAGRIDR